MAIFPFVPLGKFMSTVKAKVLQHTWQTLTLCFAFTWQFLFFLDFPCWRNYIFYHGNFIFCITANFIFPPWHFFSFSVIFLAWWHFYFNTIEILFIVTLQIILLDHGNFFLFLYFSWWQLYLVTSQSFSCNMDDKNCLPWQAHFCAYILHFSIFW